MLSISKRGVERALSQLIRTGGIALAVGATVTASAGPTHPTGATAGPSKESLQRRLDRVNQGFVSNMGQWDKRAHFLARAKNLDVWITENGVTYDQRGRDEDGQGLGHRVSMTFVGSSKLTSIGVLEKSGKLDFISDKGTFGTKRFSEALTSGIADGVTMRTYYQGGKPRYDLIVAPNADPKRIKMRFDGALGLVANGDTLTVRTKLGSLKQSNLVAYQTINGKKVSIPAKFQAVGNQVTFALGSYDRSRSLTIDPLIYGSYYGGNSGWDLVQGVVADNGGGVYLTGYTESPLFPNINGPYGFNLRGIRDAFVTKFQGDAYNHDYSAYFGGDQNDEGQFAQLDPAGNLWIAGKTGSWNFPRTNRRHVRYIRQFSDTAPSTRRFPSPPIPRSIMEPQFRLEIGRDAQTFAFDTDPQLIDDFVTQVTGIGANDLTVEKVVSGSRGSDRWAYRLTYENNVPVVEFNVISQRVVDANQELSQGLSPEVGVYFPALDVWGAPTPGDFDNAAVRGAVQDIRLRGSYPGLRFRVGYRDPATGTVNYTPADQLIDELTPANTVRDRIGALAGIGGANNLLVTTLTQPDGAIGFRVATAGQILGQAIENFYIQVVRPNGPVVYTNEPQPDIFLMRWKKDAGQFLNPLPTQTTFYGSPIDEEFLNGFAIQKIANGNDQTVFDMVVAGSAKRALPEVAEPYIDGSTMAYMLRYRWQNGSLNLVPDAAHYMRNEEGWTVGRGVALDGFNNAYIGGTVFFIGGNVNTDPSAVDYRKVFDTTSGVFENGRLLRNTDMFVRKYAPDGRMIYSALVGGQSVDYMGGYFIDVDPLVEIQTGSAISVDATGNLYLTGVSGSFNYPRTRGVYGEVFTDATNTVVTKINADASQIIYSTNLRTINPPDLPAFYGPTRSRYPEFTNPYGDLAGVKPAGIAVDSRGNAYIAGNLRPVEVFPIPLNDPIAPVAHKLGSIPISNDALDPLYEVPAAPRLATTEGFLSVLDPTATQLIYSSYVGGLGNEQVMGPYVDLFGDVWIIGQTAGNSYTIFNTQNLPTTFDYFQGPLPGAYISSTAFKPVGEEGAGTPLRHSYGAWADPAGATPAAVPLLTSTTEYRDGFIVKQRVAAPTVTSLVLNPATVPGGFGATSVATVTLSSPAPVGGAEVVFTLDNANTASFAPDTALATISIVIPAGQTTGAVTVYTNGVSQNTPVQITANYQGSFKIAQLVVIPWLQGFTVNPSAVIGGNEVVGRIVLSAPAPAGGVTVQLSTNDPTLISFPEDTDKDGLITIPSGQQTHSFRIATGGVTQNTLRNVRVTILGVSITRDITLTPASILSLTFTPNRVPDGDTALGVIRFNGAVGQDTDITVTFPAGSGLQLNPSDPNVVNGKVRLRKGQSQVSFGVLTPQVTQETLYTVTATVGANTVTTTLTVFPDPIELTSFTLDPTTVVAGGSTNATVEISVPAPVGGVAIQIFTKDPNDANRIVVESTVRIPQGQTKQTFAIGTTLSAITKTVTLVASRSGDTLEADLTITAAQISVTFDPSSVLGGQSSTGTVSISGVAPAGGIVVDLSSADPEVVQVPDSVIIPEGASSVTFEATTTPVAATVNVDVSATLVGGTATGTLTVRSTGLRAFTCNPLNLRPGRGATLRVTLESPAQVDTAVQITGEKALFSAFPEVIIVRAGSTVGTAKIIAKRFARPLKTRITATLSGTSKSVSVNLIR